MKKLTLILLLLGTVLCTVSARNLADIFRTRDGGIKNVFPYLDYNARMDMVDYREAGMTSATKDVMYNQPIEMDTLSVDYLRLNAVGMTVDVAMLVEQSDTLIVVVPTLANGSGDSSIEVYDTDWRPVHDAFVNPEYSEWLIKDWRKKVDVNQVINAVPFVSYTVDIEPEAASVILTNMSINVPGIDSSVVEVFRPTLTYKFQNRKLKPVK